MAKYINADAFIADLTAMKEKAHNDYLDSKDHGWIDLELQYDTEVALLQRIIRQIGLMPPADVREVKRGHWIEFRTEHGKCSICGNTVDLTRPEECNFCSNCGADMRGDE